MFTKKARIFDKAEKLCVSYGGHLASITDAFTNKFIYTEALKAFAPDKLDVFWLGGITWDGVDWTWTDGTPFSYTNWDGEPFADGGTCIEQQLSNGKWTTNICDNVEQYYVCALPPNVTTTTRMTTTAPLCDGNKCTYKYVIK
uniref:C-type lectin domain-containing protein n=1 Tax=Acrobeloides nanus TaxID=290746 RepID=A0A914CS83_9BILA